MIWLVRSLTVDKWVMNLIPTCSRMPLEVGYSRNAACFARPKRRACSQVTGSSGGRVTLDNRSFPIFPDLCFKTRLGAQPLIWKSFFILMQIKLIFTTKSVHLASFWKWGFLEVAYLPPYPRGLRPKEWKRVLGWGTGQIKLFFLLYSYVAGTSFVGRRSKSPLRVFPSRGQ